MKSLKLSLLLAIVLTVCSCESDFINIDSTEELPVPAITSISDFQGFVRDVGGQTLEGAIVEMGDAQEITDVNGYFSISSKTPLNRAYVKVSHEGHFDAYGLLSSQKNGRLDFALQKKELVSTISSSVAGMVAFDASRGQVSVQSNSFVIEGGQIYIGEVSVYASYIDPTASNFDEVMPGGLYGIDNTNQETGLQSFGMINVEFFGSNGEALDIQNPVEIGIEVPESLRGSAPSTIPLWYFDDDLGRWIEEGEATLSEGQYVGQVNHFTPWNVDVPVGYVIVNGKVNTLSFIPNLSFKIFLSSFPITQEILNESGEFRLFLEKNQSYTLIISAPCGESEEYQIGPFTEDSEIDLDFNTQIDLPAISGTIVNCEGNPTEKGYLLINSEDGTFIVYGNELGAFNTKLPFCTSTQIDVRAYDQISNELSTTYTLNISDAPPVTQLGKLNTCGGSVLESIVSFSNIDGSDLVFDCEVRKGPDGARPKWSFKFIDEYNGGIIEYIWTIIDLNDDPANPDIWSGFDVNILNLVPNGREFQLGGVADSSLASGEIIDIYNNQVGLPVKIRIPNIILVDNISGQRWDTEMTLQGIILE